MVAKRPPADELRDPDRLRKIEKAVLHMANRQKYHALDFYKPYPKQQEFHDAGVQFRERLFMAANQVGKSHCGSCEVAFHLTGEYPDWWLGKRFDHPVKAWAASDTGMSTRDVVQKKLCGEPGVVDQQGAGAIPRAAVDWKNDVTLMRGVSDAYDTVQVRHASGGKSILKFKSYEQGRTKWQGETLDFIWFDEEPPKDIYDEGLTRLTEGGMVFITFTPLQGRSKVVLRFLDERSPDRTVVNMTLDDAEHFSAAEKTKRYTGYAEHERDARARGEPLLGSGKIFRAPETLVKVLPFPLPPHWSLLWGFDFGIDHPFAAVLTAWDKDLDIIYVVHVIRMKNSLPLQHAAAIKPVLGGNGFKIPVAWPQDGHQRKEFEGKLEPTAQIYKKHGLKMMPHHATFVDGSNSTEAGILEMDERMLSNRLKVWSTCPDWFEEYRFYHRKDGQIVKENDDLMSATRVAIMARRQAQPVLWNARKEQKFAVGVDDDPW